jgi:hypothetical protein
MSQPSALTYRIVFTRLAHAFAMRRSSLAALEEQIRGEMAELMSVDDDGPMGIEELCFHVVEFGDQEYICSPTQVDGELVLSVDTCSREELDIRERAHGREDRDGPPARQ